MDIFDININEITKQYLESIKQMKKLDLEGAGDFIAMAATLIQIKSKMLLPQYNDQGEIIEQEDPRKDLVRRLLEYQMYQEAGQNLYRRPLLNRDVWPRSTVASRHERESIETPDTEIVLEEGNALYSLIAAYRHAVKSMKKAVHRVGTALQSISDRIWEMRHHLIVGRQVKFFDLVDGLGPGGQSEEASGQASEVESNNEKNSNKGNFDRRGHLLITFLSLLEMAKLGIVSLFQSDNFTDIHIDTLKSIDRDMISTVENYEAAQNMGAPKEIVLTDADQMDLAPLADDASPISENSPATVEPGGAIEQLELQSFLNEAATDEEILAEEMRMMASENDDWSTFAATDEGISNGEKAEKVEA